MLLYLSVYPILSFSFTYLSPSGQAPVFSLLQRDEQQSRTGSFPESGSFLIYISSLDFTSLCGKRASRKWKTGFTFGLFPPSLKDQLILKYPTYLFIHSFIYNCDLYLFI